jgi:hypothetical protein
MKIYGTIVASAKQKEITKTTGLVNVSISPMFAEGGDLEFFANNNFLLPEGVEIGTKGIFDLTEKQVEITFKQGENAGKTVKRWQIRCSEVATEQSMVAMFLPLCNLKPGKVEFGKGKDTAVTTVGGATSTVTRNTPPPVDAKKGAKVEVDEEEDAL